MPIFRLFALVGLLWINGDGLPPPENDMRLIPDTALAVVTIYQEARNQSHEGRVAVAEVIRNRMKAKYSSDGTVAGTVARKWQFSGWNTEDPNRVPSLKIDDDDPLVKECMRAWLEANNNGTNLAKGAVLYYSSDIPPPGWSTRARKVAEIGKHLFFVPL